MNKILALLSITLIISVSCSRSEPQKIDLSGEWKFAMDPEDKGISERWFEKTLEEDLMLPGSMNSNGKGDDVNLQTEWTGQIVDSSFFLDPEYEKFRQANNFKIPFWLQPLKHYQGAAWYQREISIPRGWNEHDISLLLERCHWESKVWIDQQEIGMCNSLGTPHSYDLPEKLQTGRHTLTIRIDNRIKDIDPGINSHSISDHTQTNWNGIVGALILEARPKLKLQSMKIYPDIRKKSIETRFVLHNGTDESVNAKLLLKVSGADHPPSTTYQLVLNRGENQLDFQYFMGEDVKLWDEFSPNTYTLQAMLTREGSDLSDTLSSVFGMRAFEVNEGQIQINGRPAFLRGTLECAIFPGTGYPPTDVAEWKRIFSICRAHGLNHMRFHSWCPPEAAFIAADQSGFYLQVEVSSWANSSTTLGDGAAFDRYVYEESERMMEAYGNHPSWCMMSYGNEPGGENYSSFLSEFVDYWKKKDPRRIYVAAAGWPTIDVNDFHCDPNPRIQRWGEGLNSIINAGPPRTDYDWSAYSAPYSQPFVSHEIGQWCVYPNFNEIQKYNGVVRAKNFEIFQETLNENGMGHLADSFLLASGKLQSLCYKADIEAALRTPGFGGFQLLDLHDFPGQGTALVGVLDAFWDEKGYITPEEYSRFCNSTVPLARLKKRIFRNDEVLNASVEIAHFGPEAMTDCVPKWRITNIQRDDIASGQLPQTDIPIGNGFSLGTITFPLHSIAVPQKLILTVETGRFNNSWDFWVYPEKIQNLDSNVQVLVTQKIDRKAIEVLNNGGNVLLNLKVGTLSSAMGGDIQIGFSSIFWNTAWTGGQAPHTLGILCDPEHKAFAEFPTEFHSNWQWWDAMSHSGAIDISSFPKELAPIVRVIDDWFTNRPLVLIFEAKAGNGKIIVSGIDLTSDLSARPEAQQLLYSLRKYMTSPDFDPQVEIGWQQLAELLK